MQDELQVDLDRALLVQVELYNAERDEDLQELQRLAESAGACVAGSVICRRSAPDAAYFIGSGKVQELSQLVLSEGANVVLFNAALSPAQERNLEKELGVRVMDRIALILLIFAQRARSYEGKLQVELAQLRYQQARLVRGWTHLERQQGGFGVRGGPGETQIELDRRMLRERIGILQKALQGVSSRREENRRSRKKHDLPTVCLAGYTNAGKSTLFNYLTSAQVYVADQLFATLDPTLRILELPFAGKTVFADTVGFIRHLPHDLIAAFKSTLEETAQADLLLHVVDAADPRLEENIAAVNAVLRQIGADRVRTLLVYNKSDLVEGAAFEVVRDECGVPVRAGVSAVTGQGVDLLLAAVSELLTLNVCLFTAMIEFSDGRLRALLYTAGAVERERIAADGRSELKVRIRPADAARINSQTSGALARACGGTPWKADPGRA